MKSVLSFQGSETSALLPIPESARQLGPEELQLLLLILGKAPLSESTAPGFQNYFQKALLLDGRRPGLDGKGLAPARP